MCLSMLSLSFLVRVRCPITLLRLVAAVCVNHCHPVAWIAYLMHHSIVLIEEKPK